MTLPRFVLVLVVLCLPALLPAVAAVGRRPVVLPLLLPVGGLLAAVAGVLAVATHASLTPWVTVVDVVANVAAATALLRRRRAGHPPLPSTHSAQTPALLTSTAVVAAGLSTLRRPALDWDARSIWLLHARLLRAGGGHYVAALHDRAYAFSHVDYPPLVPASIAVAWKTWGSSSYRLAQVVLALQGACLIVVAAWLVARRVGSERVPWLAPTLAGVFTLAAVGTSAAYLTNGYADIVAAAAVTIAALALLLEPPTAAFVALGLVGALIAALTKDEGVVAALLVVGLWGVRMLWLRRPPMLLLVGAVVGVAIVAWPALVAALGGPHGSVLSSDQAASDGAGMLSRVGRAFTGLAGQVPVAPPVLVAVVLLGRRVRRLWWLCALVGLDLAALFVTYTAGSLPIDYWVASSVDRVTVLARMLLYAVAAISLAAVVEIWQSRRPAVDGGAKTSEKVEATR